jgi:CheY-like chemotaxis protein/HPt (histidine-containing phosphotransfer) domain-containing protein
LVAEDNRVNQLLVVSLLEKEGHHVVTAANGNEALALLHGQHFDLVLMDVQMPKMDGFETTRLIRSMEKQSACHLPIIAMTAHALQGDRERCLEAGMDAYVAKPVRAGELHQSIQRLFPRGGYYTSSSSISAGTSQGIDRAALVARLGGKEERLEKIAAVFIEESLRLIAEMHRALESHSAARLKQAAHTLKGALGIFDAATATEAAERLELLAQSAAGADAHDALKMLQREMERLHRVLHEFMIQLRQPAPEGGR